MYGDLVTTNECDSGVKVVHRCFTEGGKILRVFSWELLVMKLQDN